MPPPFLTIFDLVMTLIFDLLTSKSNHVFISVPKCTKDVNFVKFPGAFYKTSWS